MKGGFSFCGVDIADIGLTYVPETSAIYSPYSGAAFNVSASTDGTMDGGLFYGTTLKPKEFTLRCIFEDSDVRGGIMSEVLNLFSRGRTGKLVFKNRDWLWWNATVTSTVDTSRFTNYMNGFVSVTLTAYYPFARSDIISLTGEEDEAFAKDLKNNSGIIAADKMPAIPEVFGNSTEFAVYNPGTETAKCAISIAGDLTDGIVITNSTTGQTCELRGINTGSKKLIIDSMNGKTILYNSENGSKENAYLYHRGGFIDLAPGTMAFRDITVYLPTGNDRTYVIESGRDNIRVTEELAGKWMINTDIQLQLKGVWRNTSLQTVKYKPTPFEERYTVDVVDNVNMITVTKNTPSVTIDSLEFNFKPTFR